MRTKMTLAAPERALDRVLEALGQELIDASDEEIEEAAKDLRMDIRMKGSIAFAGLRYFARAHVSDFFAVEPQWEQPVLLSGDASAGKKKTERKTRKSKRIDRPER